MEGALSTLFEAIVEGRLDAVEGHVRAALSHGIDPDAILGDCMIPAIREVGGRFEAGDCFVPEMLVAAKSMQSGLEVLKPHLQRSEATAAGRVVIGTVKGDLHDIGKNLVGLMLEGVGFTVKDLGTNVPPESFVQAVREYEPDIVAMSALLTTTMGAMKTTIDALERAGQRALVRVIVGGAPVTNDFADRIGADGYAPDASRAARLAEHLVGR